METTKITSSSVNFKPQTAQMANVTELKKIATQVRRDIIRMTNSAESGHPGGSLGCADFITALYFEVMDYSTPFEMNGLGEDIFFLSN